MQRRYHLDDCTLQVPRSHSAGTVLYLQVPSVLLNIQVPFSTRQHAIHGTVLFTPDLLTPHTAFLRLHATVPIFWNVSTHFFLPLCALIQCLVLAMPPQSLKIDHLPSDASAILRERYLAGTFSVVTQWQISCVRLYLCLNKTRTSIGSFWPFLIDFVVWDDYWLTDHPELRRTTQPSRMGGPLGEPRFCIFRSTEYALNDAIPGNGNLFYVRKIFRQLPYAEMVPNMSGMISRFLHDKVKLK